MEQIRVRSRELQFPVAEDLYGLFFEDINRAGDSGLYPEMIRNRCFEDSLLPEGAHRLPTGQFATPTGWVGEFQGGEGLPRWAAQWPETQIPGWYCTEAGSWSLNRKDVLNKKRLASLELRLPAGGRLVNIGYGGLAVEKGKSYRLKLFAKSLKGKARLKALLADMPGEEKVNSDSAVFWQERIEAALQGRDVLQQCSSEMHPEAGKRQASEWIRQSSAAKEWTVSPGDYQEISLELMASADSSHALFCIEAEEETRLLLAYVSLQPMETFLGHGLRKDLAERLAALHPAFMRYPGGCIVEGMSKRNIARFSKLIGKEWERPSEFLLWFYRTTNGFGYREFLQFCEDLGMYALYVVNCGLTCQARRPEFFDREEMEELWLECKNAIDYALAPADTPMGRRRAEEGHPAPYPLKYLEIGNENREEPYYERYRWFYEHLKAEYPQLITISNVHTKEVGLPAEIVDEHFYSDLDFFAFHHDMYDSYDRQGPKIFVGEYAVTTLEHRSALGAALGEAAFLTGIERNQDIVALTSYAPLLCHENFMCWTPDLIVFNTEKSYCIPSYYLQQIFAKNRGTHVVPCLAESERRFLDTPGWTGLWADSPGNGFSDVRVNGLAQRELKEVPALFQPVHPFLAEENGWRSGGEISYGLLGEEKPDRAEIELTLDYTGGCAGISVGNRLITRGLASADQLRLNFEGLVSFAWRLGEGESALYMVRREKTDRICLPVPVELAPGAHRLQLYWENHSFTCLLDGKVVHDHIPAASMPLVTASAVWDEVRQDIILKLVNLSDEDRNIRLELDREICSEGERIILTGKNKEDHNSMEEPERVIPREEKVTGLEQQMVYRVLSNSIQVLRLRSAAEKAKSESGR